MKDSIRKIIFFILYVLGFGNLLKFINNKKQRIPILLFHRVSDDNDKYWEPIKVKYFEKIIDFLNKNYEFISLPDLLTGKVNDFKNKCIITFDDGYEDFVANALPILEKYNIKPTLFVTTSSISNNSLIWTSELNFAIKNTNRKEIEVIGKNFSLLNEKDKINTAKHILQILINLPNKERVKILNQLKQQLDYKKPNNVNMMNWDELISISDIVDIQSHSVSHPVMKNLDMNELEKELKDSKNIIEQKLKKEVSYFSYPIGYYNDKVIGLSKKYYNASFIVEGKMLEINKLKKAENNYKIPRINITDKNIYELYFRINGFHTFIINNK